MSLAAMLIATPAMAVTFNVTIDANTHYVGSSALSVVVPQGPSDPSPVLTNQVGTVYNVAPPAPSPLPPNTPSVTNQYRSPWQYTKSVGGTQYEPIGDFTSVQANSSGDIFYGLRSGKTGLSLVWGSPDTYNTIQFLLGGSAGAVVASIDGTAVGALGFAGLGMNIIALSLTAGVFDTVRFISTGNNAFEFANAVATPNDTTPQIPLPAGLILLLSGLTGLGFLGRARAKSA